MGTPRRFRAGATVIAADAVLHYPHLNISKLAPDVPTLFAALNNDPHIAQYQPHWAARAELLAQDEQDLCSRRDL